MTHIQKGIKQKYLRIRFNHKTNQVCFLMVFDVEIAYSK